MEVARFGGLEHGEEHAPFEVVHEHTNYRLRRYLASPIDLTDSGDVIRDVPDEPDDVAKLGARPPIILVPPMMLAAEVYDVTQSSSAVRELTEAGIEPWVVDFGAPEQEEGGLRRTLTDHVLAVSDSVDRVRELCGRDVHLAGYSQGGMFCYQAAAFRRGEGIASLITFGSPVDTRKVIPDALPEDLLVKWLGNLADTVLPRMTLPAWASRFGFRLLDPVKTIRQQAEFILQLHDRDALLPRESQRRFLMGEGWVAWPGPALAEFMKQFVEHNRMLAGGFTIEGRMVTLADIECPILSFVGTVDEIAAPKVVRAIVDAAPKAGVWETTLEAGHFGLVVGSVASNTTWPTVAGWMHWREGDGPEPAGIRSAEDGLHEIDGGPTTNLSYGLELATQVTTSVARGVAAAVEGTAETARRVAAEAWGQLPRLLRLERVQPNTRISLGELLDEQARHAPDDTFFLFEGRGHTYADAKRRVDNIVRGLISVGVRQGEHVGVLMATRPSAIAVVSALSRLGAVVVMLRPDGETPREAGLGQVTRIICDPEHAGAARAVHGAQALVLGGGGEPRELGFGLFDMERIDPGDIPLPAWYSPNPGRAQDLAFIVFTGRGDRTHLSRITNRRWATSAFGTATAARLGRGDTVYCVTPIHHPSGLLMSVGGAVAGGARLALATSYDPTTFWDEVRRYGVTVVSYTWTLLRPLVEAPAHPSERGHPVRLFIGSGMPSGLWRRVIERFAPARVVEFYAATETGAVLADVSGSEIGSKGKPLPGSARVRIARYDATGGRLEVGRDGFAISCDTDEVGMLLAEVDAERAMGTHSPLRGVFRRYDAWMPTGDLFRRDSNGNFWLVDHVVALTHTADGIVYSVPIEDALGRLAGVDLVAAYGVPGPGGNQVSVVAVTLRDDHALTGSMIASVLGTLPRHQRPEVVHVVAEIPLSTWFRPIKPELRAAGLPEPGSTPSWCRHTESGGYVTFGNADRVRLLGDTTLV